MKKLSGILPAIVTPLNADESLNAGALERLVQEMYAAGVDGLYVCGNTGEGLLLPVDVRQKAAEIAVANSPSGKQVIVHTGAYRAQDAIRLTKHASKLGVAAVSSLPPGLAYGFPETKAYYESIAAAASVPVLVYHFPSLAPPISLDQLEELCGIPNVAGLKFTSFDLYSLRQLVLRGWTVFNGHDEVLAPGLLMGASGGIGSTYNLMPHLFAELFRKAQAGNWHDAIAVQDRINRLIRILLQFPLIPAIKHVLTWRGIPCGPAVAPRRTLTEAESDRLKQLLNTWEREA